MEKKLCQLVVLLIILCSFSTYSFASTTSYSEEPTIGIESTYINYGNGYIGFDYIIFKSSIDSNLILNTSAGLGKLSNTTLEGYASIMCSDDVSKLGYSMTFQEWNGFNWTDIKTISNSAANSQYLDGYHYCDAKLQNYYRVKVSFFAGNETRTMYSTHFQLK